MGNRKYVILLLFSKIHKFLSKYYLIHLKVKTNYFNQKKLTNCLK